MLITANFVPPDDRNIKFRAASMLIRPIVLWLQANEATKEWLLAGDTEKESYLYQVFNERGKLTDAAEAVLETEYKGETVRSIAAWNGEKDEDLAAGLSFLFHSGTWPPRWSLEIDYPDGLLSKEQSQPLIAMLQVIAKTLNPRSITVDTPLYFDHKVFPERAGVGWMLYLPGVLTVEQVPEARALVPVLDDVEKKQIGTIIASEIEDPFDYKNPEHVKVANRIEIRLADQDLLPLLTDL